MITTVKINRRTNQISREQKNDTTIKKEADLANESGMECASLLPDLAVMVDAANVVVIFRQELRYV